MSVSTGKLLAAVVSVFMLIHVLLFLVFSTPFSDTCLFHASQFLRAKQGADSWRPMTWALDYALTAPPDAKPLYAKLFFGTGVQHKGFQYPPTSLLPMYALRLLTGDPSYGAAKV